MITTSYPFETPISRANKYTGVIIRMGLLLVLVGCTPEQLEHTSVQGTVVDRTWWSQTGEDTQQAARDFFTPTPTAPYVSQIPDEVRLSFQTKTTEHIYMHMLRNYLTVNDFVSLLDEYPNSTEFNIGGVIVKKQDIIIAISEMSAQGVQ